MSSTVSGSLKAIVLVTLGLAVAAMGIYVGEADDAPGAAVMGFLLMVAAVVIGVRAARNRLPLWAGRMALAVGVLVAAFAAFLSHAVTVAAPLFAASPGVPSVAAPAPSQEWAAAIERARPLVRAAIADQNLPGVSVAVGVAGHLVWAEGFGWRDVLTETPMTPETRFNIGSATPLLSTADVAPLGLTNTGRDTAADWSPSHAGEPEEDFPLFTLVHDVILRPIGIAPPAQPLKDHRATFYVPRSGNDPRRGRNLMYMRDLVCCEGKTSFYSTPSDLVRFAHATNAASINGALAGGSVLSVVTRRDQGLVVAVASNIAYADTAAIARNLAEVFAGRR